MFTNAYAAYSDDDDEIRRRRQRRRVDRDADPDDGRTEPSESGNESEVGPI